MLNSFSDNFNQYYWACAKISKLKKFLIFIAALILIFIIVFIMLIKLK